MVGRSGKAAQSLVVLVSRNGIERAQIHHPLYTAIFASETLSILVCVTAEIVGTIPVRKSNTHHSTPISFNFVYMCVRKKLSTVFIVN